MDVDQILCLGSESATVKGSKQAESLSQTHILLDRIRELVTQQEGSTGEGSTGSLASNPELGWTLYRAVKLGVEHSVLEDALGGAAVAPESQLKKAHDAWVKILNASTCDRDSWDERAPPHRPNMQRGL